MKKIFVLALILLSSCSQEKENHISFFPLTNYPQDQLEVVQIAENLTNEMLHSSCFEQVFLNRQLAQTENRSNKEVINHLRSLKGSVPVVMYYSFKNVVGYRSPPSPTVYTNSKFHNNANACERASNLAHEAVGHSLGNYDHDYYETSRRPYSVPYSLNTAFEKCCACSSTTDCKILETPAKTTKQRFCYRSWKYLWLKKVCYTTDVPLQS